MNCGIFRGLSDERTAISVTWVSFLTQEQYVRNLGGFNMYNFVNYIAHIPLGCTAELQLLPTCLKTAASSQLVK